MSNSENKNYAELFCEAIDIIAEKRASEIIYDQTVECTIVDDSKAKDGEYLVSNGQGKFTAYSTDTSYRKNMNVYVQVPQGDWNEQKIITARKVDKNDVPITYQRPLDRFVDITGNMISKAPNAMNLIANHSVTERVIWSYNVEGSSAVIKDDGLELGGYTRLGIAASFRSWLNDYNVIAGNYGLKLRIEGAIEDQSRIDKENADDNNEDKIEIKTVYYDYILSSKDMVGNPYNFATYVNQEKLFDISGLYKITRMELMFYQEEGSFKYLDTTTDTVKLVPHMKVPAQFGTVDPNLFINDIRVGFGYDIGEFDTDTVRIYTFESSKYVATQDPPQDNHKPIHLRWIHKDVDEDSIYQVTNKSELDYEITWYRKALGEASHTAYSGVDWRPLSRQYKDDRGLWAYEILDKDWLDYNSISDLGFYREPGFQSTWLIPDITWATEAIKAVLTYNGQVHFSNILTFTNEREVVSKPTVDAIQALTINCDDETYGNYLIYNVGGTIGDSSQAKMERTLTAMFKSSLTNEEAQAAPLAEAESIEWIIPRTNTMFIVDDQFLGAEYSLSTEEWQKQKDDLEAIKDTLSDDEYKERLDIINKKVVDNEFYHIFRYGEKDNGYNIRNANYQQYRIKSFYSQTYTNNTIQCKVIKDKVTYTATKEFTFGPAGTSGTDYTLVLDFEDDVSALTKGSNKAVKVRARLYDYANKELTGLDKYKVNWSWKTSNGLISIIDEGTPAWSKELQLVNKDSALSVNYHILQATLKDYAGSFDLTAYLSIPIRASEDYKYLQGPINVLYDTSGNLIDYFQAPYRIYKANSAAVQNLTWTLSNGVSAITEEPFMPKFSMQRNEYYLRPLSIYVANTCEKVSISAVSTDTGETIWTQPLIIMQNRYPSAMINKWDGALKIDATNNAILAAKIAAGRKNYDDNTFSGVMMGDWGTSDGTSEQLFNGTTGLYGFHHGEQSFAFMDDGTAFIGKSGKGRIIFQGDEGYIASAGFLAGDVGVKLDLDSSPFLQIRGYDTGYNVQDIMYIGDGRDGNYLQSANYEEEEQGLHIDLNDGKFSAAGEFTLEAGDDGQIRISTDSPYFQVKDDDGCTLINMADDDYYLQSHNYEDADEGIKLSLGSDYYLKAKGNFDIEAEGDAGTLLLTSDTAKNPISVVNADNSEHEFTVDWEGNVKAMGGSVGGWHIYAGSNPPKIDSISDRWNVIYAKSDNGLYHVFGANQDNVIAIGIPSGNVFSNHNFLINGNENAVFTVTKDGSINARKGQIAGWHLTSTALQNFAEGGTSERKTILYSGKPDEAGTIPKFSIETDSINITGTNSKLQIGVFTFNNTSFIVDADKKGAPYELVINSAGDLMVGNVTGTATTSVANFKVSKNGDLTIGPNGDSYKVSITSQGELSIGQNWQDRPYFQVLPSGKVRVGPKYSSKEGDDLYYFTLSQYGELKCGGVTIKDTVEDNMGMGDSTTVTTITMGSAAGAFRIYAYDTSKNAYLMNGGRIYLSGGGGKGVFVNALTFSALDSNDDKYLISSQEGRVLAMVIKDWCNGLSLDGDAKIAAAAKQARYAYFA